MGVSILPPSAPLPPRRDAPEEDSDVDMSDDELPTSNNASIVTPGEHITSDPQWMRGHGTYVPAGS